MRKNLIAALVTLGLGGGTLAAFVADTALADSPNGKPMVALMTQAALAQDTSPSDAGIQLAQASPANRPAGPGRAAPPPGRGAGRAAPRPAPSAADQAARQQQMCQDTYARAAGKLAYLEARLALTANQGAAFTRWRDTQLAEAKRGASACAARPAPQGRGAAATLPNPVDLMARQETMLQQRLSDVQAERPALDALYTILTPAQRETFTRTQLGGDPLAGGRGRGPNMRGRGPGGRGGPRGRGPGGRGGPPGRGPQPQTRGAPPPAQ